MTTSRRLAPLPLLLAGMAALAVLVLIPWVVQAQSRDVGSDFILDAANGYPTGIWSDGTTMWVADFEDAKLYAYRMSDRTRDADRDFTLDAAHGSPVGIWSDGTTMWASDFADGKLYAYRMSDRSRDSGKDFDTLSAVGNDNPESIWSDRTTMWVADVIHDKLYAYRMSDRARDADKDFTLDPSNDFPVGIWSNGYTMWVVDWRDAKLYAYSMSDRSRDAGKDFALDADDQSTEGLWSAGATMWVASRDDGKLYAYDWNNPPTGAPTIIGRVRVDETLTAGTSAIADADGLDAAIFEYQWVSNDGNADTDIAGTTDSTYTIVPGDRGRAVKVRVSFTDGAGNRESLTSEPTGRGPGHLRPDACGDGGHRRRDDRRRRLLQGFRNEAQDLDRLPALRPRRHARAVPSGERTVGPADRGFPGSARAARPGPEQKLPRDGPGRTLRRPPRGGGVLSVGKFLD